MAECKYFYNGILLSKYCEDNGISFSTIRSRIYKLRKSNPNLPDDELVRSAIEEYENKNYKYFYKGQPLVEYCNDNNLNYDTIQSRISILKRNDPNLSKDELVRVVLEEFKNINYKYFYNGQPLTEYCEENGLKYDNIRKKIHRLKLSNPNLSDDELVKLALEMGSINRNYKYFYKGMSLSKYCEDNGINYDTIRVKLARLKLKNPNLSSDKLVRLVLKKILNNKYFYKGQSLIKYCKENDINYNKIKARIHKLKSKNQSLSDNELVRLALEEFENIKYKYFYNNIDLRTYCRENNIRYTAIYSRIYTLKSYNSNLSDDELVRLALEEFENKNCRYFYSNMSLHKYCRENNIRYYTIKARIYTLKLNNPDLSDDELVKFALEEFENKNCRYYYNNISLRQYCIENNINYYNIRSRIYRLNLNNPDLSDDELIRLALENSESKKYKYFYNGQRLSRYCKDNDNLPYNNIRSYIVYRMNINPNQNIEGLVDEAIESFKNYGIIYYNKERLYIRSIMKIFENLAENKPDTNQIAYACHFLGISWNCVCNLMTKGFDYNRSINLVWYFHDEKDSEGKIYISENKIGSLYKTIEKVSEFDANPKDESILCDIDLYDLIGIYKCKLYDTRNAILTKQKKYIYGTVNLVCSQYGITINNDNAQEIENETIICLMNLLEKMCLNIPQKVYKYMYITLNGNIRKSIKRYYAQSRNIYLDSPKYNEDSDSNSGESKIDYISLQPKEDDNSEENISEILNSLPVELLTFVALKYKEGHSNEELAQYFSCSMQEIKRREYAVISSLKQNPKLKKYVRFH